MGAAIVSHQVVGELMEHGAASCFYGQHQPRAGNLYRPWHTVQDLQAGDVGQQIITAIGTLSQARVTEELAAEVAALKAKDVTP